MVSASSSPPRRHPTILPVHPGWLGVILVGGMIGTAIRAGLETAFASPSGGVPWATFGINISGAFLLGTLLETLSATGRDVGWRRTVRLGVGTGALGGYTTYSTFAVETMTLLQGGAWLVGTAYALGSVTLGFTAALAGITLARAIVRTTTDEVA